MKGSHASLAVAVVLLGMALGLGAYTFAYAKGWSYMTNDPRACANCHVMNEQYDGWLKSSHRSVAVCNDCHVPHNFVGKYVTKATNGFWHSYYFTTRHVPRADPGAAEKPEDRRGQLPPLPRADRRRRWARRHTPARATSPASAATARWATWSCPQPTSRR